MKTISIVKYVFLLVGCGLLIGAVFLFKDTQSFLKIAERTDGKVVDLVAFESTDTDDNRRSVTYAPVVEFLTKEGEKITFTSSTRSYPPSYSRGEAVEIFYLPGNPEKAKINDFFSLWGIAVVFGGLGIVFFLTGTGIIFFIWRKKRSDENLKLYGTKIQAKFMSVEINSSLQVNGRSPWRILAQWQNPATSKVHVFNSNNLWFDPTDLIEGASITVFINRKNLKKYYVDTSFLPERD
jgi:hypothetical protein